MFKRTFRLFLNNLVAYLKLLGYDSNHNREENSRWPTTLILHTLISLEI